MQKNNSDSSGFILVISFFVFLGINSLVIFLANVLFPKMIVLGTGCASKTWAIVHSMFSLSLVNTFLIPFIREYEKLKGQMVSTKGWMALYFFANFVAVWLIARLAENLGLGISSWLVALALAMVLDIFQGFAMMKLEKSRKNN